MKITPIPQQPARPKRQIFDAFKDVSPDQMPGRPTKKTRIPIDKQHTKVQACNLDPATFQKFREICDAEDVKPATLVRNLIQQYIRDWEAKQL